MMILQEEPEMRRYHLEESEILHKSKKSLINNFTDRQENEIEKLKISVIVRVPLLRPDSLNKSLNIFNVRFYVKVPNNEQ